MSNLLNRTLHFLNQKRCMQNAEWVGDELACKKCGEIVAIRYQIGNEIRVFVYPKFKEYKRTIERRKDTQEVTGEGTVVGAIQFDEFSSILDCLRYDESEIYNVSGYGDWIEEDCSSEEPDLAGADCEEYGGADLVSSA